MKFSQPGTVMFVTAGLTCIGAVIVLAGRSLTYLSLFPVFIVIFVLLPLFYKLEVEVTDQAVDARFGIGLIHRHIEILDITEAKAVRNPLWMGWGIRFGLNYTLYNVSGLDAVELTLKGRERKIRIGTNAPEALASVINEKILL